MSRRYISEFDSGESVDEVFLLVEKKLGRTRKGSHYLKLHLADRTGTIEAWVWDAKPEWLEQLAVEDYLRVRGVVEEYQERLQLRVTNFQKVNAEEVEPSDFISSTEEEVDALFEEMVSLASSVKNRHLSALLRSFLEDDEFVETFKKAPAGMRFHHPYLGGLLEHTLAVVKMVDPLCGRRELNRDLLLTGAILHDIGKVREFEYEKIVRYSDEGQLVGHITIGAIMISERASRLKDFPPELLSMLLHIVLSHHGEYEYGSPRLPLTREALALHYLDNLDAKLFAFTEAIEKSGEESWSEYIRMLQRRVFTGEVPE